MKASTLFTGLASTAGAALLALASPAAAQCTSNCGGPPDIFPPSSGDNTTNTNTITNTNTNTANGGAGGYGGAGGEGGAGGAGGAGGEGGAGGNGFGGAGGAGGNATGGSVGDTSATATGGSVTGSGNSSSTSTSQGGTGFGYGGTATASGGQGGTATSNSGGNVVSSGPTTVGGQSLVFNNKQVRQNFVPGAVANGCMGSIGGSVMGVVGGSVVVNNERCEAMGLARTEIAQGNCDNLDRGYAIAEQANKYVRRAQVSARVAEFCSTAGQQQVSQVDSYSSYVPAPVQSVPVEAVPARMESAPPAQATRLMRAPAPRQ